MWPRCSWTASLHRAVNIWAALFWLHVALFVCNEQLPELYSFAAQLWAARSELALARLALECLIFCESVVFAQQWSDEDEEDMLNWNMEQNLQEKVQQLIQSADVADVDFSSFGSNDCLLVSKTQLGIKLDTCNTSALVWSASQEGPPSGASQPSIPVQAWTCPAA